jgi:23S rRNA pseudouridine1911/1915/1917 synthase
MEEATQFETIVSEDFLGLRLDVFIASLMEDASRSYIQKMIKDGRVSVNGHTCLRSSRTVALGETVVATIPPVPRITLSPEAIPLDILYQDADVLVVNKPSGLVVHPAPGHHTGTLVNAVLYHCPDFITTDGDPIRPGIVHRLDAYTSGVMVVAKTPPALANLAQQAHDHLFDRRYLALARGVFKEDRGRIVATIGRSLSDPSRMSVTGIQGRDAVTGFEVLERFGAACLVSLQLETGRTHQIRVHLRFAGHPVLGDSVYGVTDFSTMRLPDPVTAVLKKLNGQALHAERLGFTHPTTGERMTFTSQPPADFQEALDALRTLV